MPVTRTPTPAAAANARSSAVRWFGRLQLLRLLGKSGRTMAWRVADPRAQQELVLLLPRVQPADAVALEHWQHAVRQAARLDHPNLAAVVEHGVQDGWPFVAYDPRDDATLAERQSAQGLPGAEVAALMTQLLQGLAFAHDAGVAHHDLQPYMALVSDSGQLRLAGAAVAAEMAAELAARALPTLPAGSSESMTLRSHRAAAERDVLGAGLLLHGLLLGSPAADEPDIGRLIERMPPFAKSSGREIVRMPWSTAHPIAEPLRAIVNRATDRQERQRYRNARTLLRALEGWLQADNNAGGGPLALLSERLRTAGVLPSSPGAAARAAKLALMERERTNELAEVVLQDLALSFELLRLVNTAQVRGAQVAGGGPVLTLRRAIAMLGLDGVRRAALALREWPGPLQVAAAAQLQTLIDRCQHAGRVAMALRPAGYDAEVVYLVSLLQSLGRLVVQYHFADEAQQIRRLMQAAPASTGATKSTSPAGATGTSGTSRSTNAANKTAATSVPTGQAEEPGMSEEAASFAVLGVDTEAIGAAVARHWGLDDSVLAMVRRLPLATPVRTADSDDELLRSLASCANEAVDALALPPLRVAAALQRVAQRYGRVLNINLRDLEAALGMDKKVLDQAAAGSGRVGGVAA